MGLVPCLQTLTETEREHDYNNRDEETSVCDRWNSRYDDEKGEIWTKEYT